MRHLVCVLLLVPAVLAAQTTPEAVQRLLDEGIQLHDAREYRRAIAKYDSALALEPANPSLRYEKAYSLLHAGDTLPATELLEQLIREPKPGTSTILALANLYDDQGKHRQAIKLYDKGIRLYPTYGLMYYNKAIAVLRSSKDTVQAEALLVRSLQHNPRHVSSWRVLGRLCYNSPTPLRAILPYTVVVTLEPTSDRGHETVQELARLLISNVKLDSANRNANLVLDVGQPGYYSSMALMAQMAAVNAARQQGNIAEFKLRAAMEACLHYTLEQRNKLPRDDRPIFQVLSPALTQLVAQKQLTPLSYHWLGISNNPTFRAQADALQPAPAKAAEAFTYALVGLVPLPKKD